MSNLLRNNKLITSILVSIGILIIGFFLNHNKLAFIALAVFLFSIDINSTVLKLSASRVYTLIKMFSFIYIAGDLAYNFRLQYHIPIDGDFVRHVLPEKTLEQLFTDPFGISVLTKHARYQGSNRFFGHWFQYKYFNTIPFLFQHFASPIDSIFLSCALLKVIIKIIFIYLFGAYMSGQYRVFNKDFLIAALLITPILQTCGFVWSIGIIDPDITGMGYAVNVDLLLVFFMPFFMKYYYQRALHMTYFIFILLMLVALIAAFYGPLTIIIIMVCPLLLLYDWWQYIKNNNNDVAFAQKAALSAKQISRPILILFTFAIITTLYSYYIGTFNIENFITIMPIWQRYLKIPAGLHIMFFNKGMCMLAFLMLINIAVLIKKKTDPQAKRTLWLFVAVILFSIAYTVLLPLGGYRAYRPYTVRRDTLIPVLVAIYMFYGVSTFYVLKNISIPIYKKTYSGSVVILLLYFIVTNGNNKFDNTCQRRYLQQLAASREKIVHLDSNCTFFNWNIVTDYNDSKTTSELLLRYKVINEERYFDQK